ncbi:MAG: cupin domain-containing protein [Actinomycetota bacterium]|nr:cupin domain-containing protein [Actinomycetota bacterium]
MTGAARAAYATAHLSEIPTLASDLVEGEWKPVRYHFGISAFGVNAYVGRAEGELVIEEHAEGDDGHEELYVVLEGQARFTIAGETFDATAGTFVFVAPTATRMAVAREPGTVVLALGAAAGRAFAPSEWERSRTT